MLQWFPSTSTYISGGSQEDGILHLENCKYTLAIKVEKGYWRWGGQREGCFICNDEVSEETGPQLQSVLPCIRFATPNTQERSWEACNHVVTLPRASPHLLFFLSQRWCLCHKQYKTSGKIYSKLYKQMINEKRDKNFCKVVSISWKLPLYLRIPE